MKKIKILNNSFQTYFEIFLISSKSGLASIQSKAGIRFAKSLGDHCIKHSIGLKHEKTEYGYTADGELYFHYSSEGEKYNVLIDSEGDFSFSRVGLMAGDYTYKFAKNVDDISEIVESYVTSHPQDGEHLED